MRAHLWTSLLNTPAQTSGVKLVNESVSYTDIEGNSVTFPAPTVEVSCDIQVDPEPCPVPVELTVERCQDSLVADLGSTYLESLGASFQLDVTVKNVCPGKRSCPCCDPDGNRRPGK